MASKLTTAKRQSYTVSDKLRIIQFAEQNGNRAAEREFGVSESVLYRTGTAGQFIYKPSLLVSIVSEA